MILVTALQLRVKWVFSKIPVRKWFFKFLNKNVLAFKTKSADRNRRESCEKCRNYSLKMAWQQQNYGGDQGYGQGQQYGQQFNQQYGNGQSPASQGYNQGNQNWKAGPANMDAGPGHFGMSNSVSFSDLFWHRSEIISKNPNYGYGAQRYNGNGKNSNMPQRRGAPRPMGQNNSQKKDSNKSINAVEVKSYINAW